MPRFLIALLFAVFASAGITACDDDGPAENAGEEIDDAADQASDAAEEAGDQMQEAGEEATE